MKPDDNVAEALITRLEETEIVRENRRRAVMRVRTKKTELVDDYDKLKTGNYKRCPDCSRVICNTYFTRHKKNGICIKTNATKKISAECGAVDTTRQEDLICKITGIKNKKSNRAGSSTE